MSLEPLDVQCPYCGEIIQIEIDPSVEEQDYIEDCSVCCRPIQFNIGPGVDGPEVSASRSD